MDNKTRMFLVIVVSLAITFFFQFHAVFDYYTINDDVRVESFIFFKSLDNELFENSLQAEWIDARNPIGYKWIYIVGTHLFRDPIVFGKVLTFFLAVVLGIFLFKLGFMIGKREAWAFLCVFLVQIWAFPSMSGGMSRVFAYPLIVAFIYYLVKKSFFKMAVIMLLQLLIYPISILISLVVLIFSQIKVENYRRLKKKIFTREFKISLVLMLLFSLLIISFYSYPKSEYLELADKGEIKQDSIYGEGGRKNIYPAPNLFSIILKFCLVTFFLSLILLPYLIYKRQIPHLHEVSILALSGLVLYILAVIFLPKLYYPQRYIMYTLPLFFSFFIVSGVSVFVNSLKAPDRIKTITFFLITALVCLLILPTTQRDLICCEHEELYNFLKEKPKDILIAGHPYDTSCIPTFAKRNVLVSHESLYPIYINYYKIMENRLYDLFTAYYSESSEEVNAFCLKYNITYIVVNENQYPIYNDQPESEGKFLEKKYYIEPFNTKINQLIESKRNFYLINNHNLISMGNNISLYPCHDY
ncbi:MAG: hypothetical protein KAS15_05335 [Nanoarchaeota archaeon]|nr:hypothetical protein [Nanoarchaeota archaeon]